MQPEFKSIKETKLVGMFTNMSLIENKTFDLFSEFMPKRKQIQNNINSSIYDLIIYPPGYFQNFNPANTFKKGAMIAVLEDTPIPDGMVAFTLVGGDYAVFSQKENELDATIMEAIFTKWLPSSKYQLDDRPHFDILNENSKGKGGEVWIPIKSK